MRPLRIILDFLSYDGTLTNDPADSNRIKNKIEEENISKDNRQQLIIPNLTVDQAITLPDASCDYLLLFVDREVSIKLNGSSDAIAVKPRANGKKSFAFYSKGTISSLSISNASGDACNVDIIALKV